MKTTVEGLTHLVNMLADVVNLQRKAQATPDASCEVALQVDEEKNRVLLSFYAEVNVAAEPRVTSGDVPEAPFFPHP